MKFDFDFDDAITAVIRYGILLLLIVLIAKSLIYIVTSW